MHSRLALRIAFFSFSFHMLIDIPKAYRDEMSSVCFCVYEQYGLESIISSSEHHSTHERRASL